MNKQTFYLCILALAICYHASHTMQEDKNEIILSEDEKKVIHNLQEIVKSNDYKACIGEMESGCADANASFQECIEAFVEAAKSKSPPKYRSSSIRCLVIKESKQRSSNGPLFLSQEQKNELEQRARSLLPIAIFSSTEHEFTVEIYDIETKKWKTYQEQRQKESEYLLLPWSGGWFQEKKVGISWYQ